ncbi:MAG: hypothetical protein Q4B36_00185 [Tissierellia bacterium]|nr:hypothetical protein [Tissierellia bacterium]
MNKLKTKWRNIIIIIIIGLILLFLREKILFVPILSNVMMFASLFLLFVAQILIIKKINFTIKKKAIRIILLVLLSIILILYLFLGFLFVVFSTYDNTSFEYKGSKYYINDTSFLDPYYEIYKKKNIFIMEKAGDYSRGFISKKDLKSEKIISYIIKSINEKDIPIEESNTSSIENIEEDIQKERNNQKILDDIDKETVNKISNSNFAIVEIDRAMARSKWFFVKIENDEFIYISTIPDTSPKIKANVDSNGIIYLECEDINGNISKYKSLDNGLTWKIYKD